MKRLFGLIGLTYLSALTVVFYFGGFATIIVISAALAVVFAAVILKIAKHDFRYLLSCLIMSGTALLAVLSLFLYQNIIYQPIIDKYSDKEIKLTGYIADEPELSGKAVNYVIETHTVNGEEVNCKISFRTYYELEAEEFDEVNVTAKVFENDSPYSKSRGIFLYTETDENLSVKKTGEKHTNLYSYAVSLRKAVKSVFDKYFSGKELALVKAIILGDKSSLPDDIRQAFNTTGTSFLIVVSGMHLSFAIAGFLFLSKKLGMHLPLLIASILFTIVFAAVTGFNPSVIRAGVMQIIVLVGTYLNRQHDNIVSLGIAALVLTLGNPFAVGNIGMMLSFATMLGIVLWSKPIYSAIQRVTGLKKAKIAAYQLKNKFASKFIVLILKIPSLIIMLFAVSVSASLWAMPLTVIAFEKISGLTVIISIMAEPLAAIILWCAMLTVILSWAPVLPNIFAFAASICCKMISWLITGFAKLPMASIDADELYIYIWLGATIFFAFLCYILWRHRKGAFYPMLAVLLSIITLYTGFSVTYFFRDTKPHLTLNCDSGGMIATVKRDNYLSLISCGGTQKGYKKTAKIVKKNTDGINMVVIPSQVKKYSGLYNEFSEEFDVGKVFVYDNRKASSDLDLDGARSIQKNSKISLILNPEVHDTVYATDKFTCQYIKSENTTVLFMTAGCDMSKLPENMREADYVVTYSVPKHFELMKCKTLMFWGRTDMLEKYSDELNSVSEKVTDVRNQMITIDL